MLHLFIVVLVATSHITVNNAFKMQPRIVRGYEAGPAQFPYYAFLEIEHLVEMGPVMGCGATLISNEYILTAAHCLTEASKLHVHLGMYDFSQYFDPEHIIITVEKKDFLIYPRYFKPIAWNDIALIRLPKKVRFTPFIQPARLPTKCESTENVDVLAIGNGATSDKSGASPQLHFALLKTLPLNVCRRQFPFILLRKSIICAQNDVIPQSVCRGDSGGPLIRRSDDTLIGVTDFVRGDGCETGAPQGFTNLYLYLKWIKEVTGLDVPRC